MHNMGSLFSMKRKELIIWLHVAVSMKHFMNYYTVAVKWTTTIAEDYPSTYQCYQHGTLEWNTIIPETITYLELMWRAYIFSWLHSDKFCSKLPKDILHKQQEKCWCCALFQNLLMSQSQILEGGLRQMECVAGWSCGFGTYSPIQLPVITKAFCSDPICHWKLVQGMGIGTTMA